MLILFKFPQQILQITFVLAVVGIALLPLSYFRIVALQSGTAFVGDRGSDWIVSDWVIRVVDASLVLFRGGILRMLNREYMIDVDVSVGWIYHVEVMLVTLTHRIFSGMNYSFLLVGPVPSQRLLVDWRLLVLLVLRATTLSLIWRFGTNDLGLELYNVPRLWRRGHGWSVVSTSMHYIVMVIRTSATVVVEQLILFAVDFITVLDAYDAVGVSIGVVGDVALVLRKLVHQISIPSIRELHLLHLLVLVRTASTDGIPIEHTLCLPVIVLEGALNCSIVLLAILVHLDIIGDHIVLACRALHSLIFLKILVRGIVDISAVVHVLKVWNHHLILLFLLHILHITWILLVKLLNSALSRVLSPLMQSVQLFLKMLVIVLCLPMRALALRTLVRALLLGRVLVDVPIVATISSLLLLCFIYICDVLRFWSTSALVLLVCRVSLFVFDIYHVHNINVIVIGSPRLLVVVVVRMDRIGVEITDVLCLCIKLAIVSEIAVRIYNLNLFM